MKTTDGLASHTDGDVTDVERSKQIIAKALSMRRGRDSSISSSMLASRVPISQTTVRDIIPQLRREHDMPIVSGPTGYYLLDDAQDLERQLARMDERIATIRERKQELTRAFNQDQHREFK